MTKPVLCACCYRPLEKHADGLIPHCQVVGKPGVWNPRTIFTPIKDKK